MTVWYAVHTRPHAEAQALATAKAGPRKPHAMDTWLAGALTINFGMVRGNTRVLFSK